MFKKRVLLMGLLMQVGLLLAACGGGEATAVPNTPTPQPTNTATAVPPTDTPTPPPPTATPEPSPTPDITANFEPYNDEARRVAFQFPPDWELEVDEQTRNTLVFVLTSGEDVIDLLSADDYSQPVGFAIGEIRWMVFSDTNDPGQILADWADGAGLEMTPTGDVLLQEVDGVQFASQSFEALSGSDSLLLTAVVIVNGGRYGTFAYGTTAAGADTYADIAAAIIDSLVLPYVEPGTEPPKPEPTAVPTPTPQEIVVEVVNVDFEDPASVLQAVFRAAQSGDFSQLAGLCDPLGENDGDTADICAMTADDDLAASFREWFATGQITGEAAINGDQAELPFTFGPNGDQDETMTLIRRNGRWYLSGF